jgi:hypothetical protein
MKLRGDTILLTTIMFFNAIMIICCIKYGHNWGDDFALYIAQSKSIVESSINELYTVNKYSMDGSDGLIGPYLYPFGFPLLLSPIYYFFGINFFLMKGFCGFFLILSIPIIYRLFKNEFSKRLFLFTIILGFAFHAEFITFSDNILSDLPFFFFSNLSLLLMTKNIASYFRQFILGATIFFSFFIRDIGIVLLPALFSHQIQILFTQRGEKRRFMGLFIPYLVFAFFFALTKTFLPNGGANHLNALLNKNTFWLLIYNLENYKSLINQYFFNRDSILLFVSLLTLVVFGMIQTWRRNINIVVYTFLISLILLIWPGFQGYRFVFPIIPFIFYFKIKGILFIWNHYKINEKWLHLLMSFYFCFFLFNQLVSVNKFIKSQSNSAYTIEMKSIYDYISVNVPQNDVIVFFKPRVLRLFTERNAISIDQNRFTKSKANYLLIQNKQISDDYKKEFNIIYTTENYILIKKVSFPID